jgi:exoribonuclease R
MRRRLAFADGARLAPAFAAIRADEQLPDRFPPDVLAEAERAAVAPSPPGTDLTDIPFVTLDPPTSMDLDQAFHLEARRATGGAPAGYRIRYAIADVGAFVRPGGALDREASARVTTIYCPDRRVPLHPEILSEGAASLLPGSDRPALVWTIDIDTAGLTTDIRVERATVRSRAKLGYGEAQAAIDDGSVEGPAALLPAVGRLLLQAEHGRGGMSLRVPSQEVEETADGRYQLRFRRPLPVEDWNAQLSLLTGRAAAQLMLDARIGILRTMPAAEPRDVERLRRVAAGLGIDWPRERAYGDLVKGLTAETPRHAAFLNEASALFRGAGYAAFDGTVPELVTHAAIAAPYAHVTAPLRRLVDRAAGETCLAICAGRPVPDAVRAALPLLPAAMAEGTRRAARVERASIDLVEAAVLEPYVGQRFSAVVVAVDDDGDGGEIVLPDLAVMARCSGRLPLGERTDVILEQADPAARRLRFRPADGPAA